MTLRKYLVLLSVVVFGSIGDTFLARGMKDVGAIDIHHVAHVFTALANPWVIFGIFFLLGFMSSYMTALSFADLTYVLPATAIGYVIMALLSIFWLHEHVSLQRWAGIALIVAGVGLVAGGPSRTEHPPASVSGPEACPGAAHEEPLHLGLHLLRTVCSAAAGDVLIALAMRRIGDLGTAPPQARLPGGDRPACSPAERSLAESSSWPWPSSAISSDSPGQTSA